MLLRYPHSGQEGVYALLTGPVGGVLGALVVNLTCEVRRVAKLPSEPRGDAYQIRQAKYVDSSHPNTRTSQGALGQGVAALQIHLCKGIVKSYPTPALHGLAPFPRTSNPKRHKNNRFPKCPNPAPQKRLISKVSKPFRQSLPNEAKKMTKHEFGRVDTK